MPQLHTRLTRLEQTRAALPSAGLDLSQLDQSFLDAMAAAYAATLDRPESDWTEADLVALLDHAARLQASGRGLGELTDGELQVIVAAGDAARGRA